jgi:hypothetical protein
MKVTATMRMVESISIPRNIHGHGGREHSRQSTLSPELFWSSAVDFRTMPPHGERIALRWSDSRPTRWNRVELNRSRRVGGSDGLAWPFRLSKKMKRGTQISLRVNSSTPSGHPESEALEHR